MTQSDSKNVNKAIDNFKKHQSSCGGTCNTDSIFNKKSSAGKGDSPRNVSSKFKNNYDDIFPTGFKPAWMKKLEK